MFQYNKKNPIKSTKKQPNSNPNSIDQQKSIHREKMPRRRNTLFVADSSPPRQRNGSLAGAFRPPVLDYPPNRADSTGEPDERTPILSEARMHSMANGTLASTSLRTGDHLRLG
jgi:hypothetical protein